MTSRAAGLALFIGLSACAGHTLDVGSNKSAAGVAGGTTAGAGLPGVVAGGFLGGGPSGGGRSGIGGFAGDCPGDEPYYASSGGITTVAPHPLTPWPDTTTCIEGLGALEGTWSGHALGNGDVPDFTVSLQAGGALPCGTLSFGPPAPLPQATDPALPAPGLPQGFESWGVVPGFAYKLLDVAIKNDDISFRISWAEPWQSWCKLQRPYCDEHFGGYFCSEAMTWDMQADGKCTGQDSRGRPLGPIPCAQQGICRNASGTPTGTERCACDANGCDANESFDGLSFEFYPVGDVGQGITTSLWQSGSAPLYLKRN